MFAVNTACAVLCAYCGQKQCYGVGAICNIALHWKNCWIHKSQMRLTQFAYHTFSRCALCICQKSATILSGVSRYSRCISLCTWLFHRRCNSRGLINTIYICGNRPYSKVRTSRWNYRFPINFMHRGNVFEVQCTCICSMVRPTIHTTGNFMKKECYILKGVNGQMFDEQFLRILVWM